MKTQFIFLDIDGTLVGPDARVPESAAQAIKKAQRSGHKVFLCTGRCKKEIYENLLSMGLDGIVGSAGAYVEVDGKVIFHQPMTKEMLKAPISYLLEEKIPYILETNEHVYFDRLATEFAKEFTSHCKQTGHPCDYRFWELGEPLPTGTDGSDYPVNKIIYLVPERDNEPIKAKFRDGYTVVTTSVGLPGGSGEISELQMNKGIGIQKVLEHYRGSFEDTISLGDGENDVSMLQSTRVRVAMGNACQHLKSIATYVTDDVTNDGLHNAFCHLGLLGDTQ